MILEACLDLYKWYFWEFYNPIDRTSSEIPCAYNFNKRQEFKWALSNADVERKSPLSFMGFGPNYSKSPLHDEFLFSLLATGSKL